MAEAKINRTVALTTGAIAQILSNAIASSSQAELYYSARLFNNRFSLRKVVLG